MQAELLKTERPVPPEILFGETELFYPAHELEKWLYLTFIERKDSPLYNPEHDHLNSAKLGVLWTNVPIMIKGAERAAVAMLPSAFGSKLDKALRSFLWRVCFQVEPDFVLIFNALCARASSDRGFCLLGNHELTHCGQKLKYGCPDFNPDGSPRFSMRPHDREIFDSDIRLFGAQAVFGDQTQMVLKAARQPVFSDIDIAEACGTCVMR